MPAAGQIEAVERLVHESVAAVDALGPTALRAVIPALRAARDELRSDLEEWLATADHGADRFTAHAKRQALRSLESSLERVAELRPAMAGALARARRDTGPLAVQNLDTEIQRLSAIFGGGVPTIPQIDTAAVIARGNKLLWKRHESSARRYAGAVGEDIRKLFAVGVAKGETFEQLVTRLRRVGIPGARRRPIDPAADAGDIADGLFKRHKWWADRLVRTEMMHAYNVQHDVAIEHANDHRSEGEEPYLRRWDAAADPRTCPLCKELDRTVTTIDGKFKGGIANPPRHPMCRCVVLAWLARWGNMRGEVPIAGELPAKPKRAPRAAKPAGAPAPPTIPQPREARKLAAEPGEILDALKEHRLGDALARTDRYLERRGLVPTTVRSDPGNIAVTDDGMYVGSTKVALGYRRWIDGAIRLSTSTGRDIAEFATAAQGRHAADLTTVLKEHTDAIHQLRMKQARKLGQKWIAIRDTVPDGNAEWKRIIALEKGDAVRVFVHEALHGFTPVMPQAYARLGAAIEEITTEVSARVITEEMFGIPIIPHYAGSYAPEIQAATNAIAELTGGTKENAFRQLQEAALRFKRRAQKLPTDSHVIGAFAEDVGRVVGAGSIATENMLYKHLSALAPRVP